MNSAMSLMLSIFVLHESALTIIIHRVSYSCCIYINQGTAYTKVHAIP